MLSTPLTSSDSLVALINYIARMSGQCAESHLQKLGLTQQEFRILGCLVGETGISQKALAYKLSVKPPTLSVAIDKLEAKGYLHRQISPHDQRIKLLVLADNLDFSASNALLHDLDDILLKGIKKSEQKQLFHMLKRMADNLRSQLDTKEV